MNEWRELLISYLLNLNPRSRKPRNTSLAVGSVPNCASMRRTIDERRADRNIYRHERASPVHGVRRGRAEAPVRRPLLWGRWGRQNSVRAALCALGCGRSLYRGME